VKIQQARQVPNGSAATLAASPDDSGKVAPDDAEPEQESAADGSAEGDETPYAELQGNGDDGSDSTLRLGAMGPGAEEACLLDSAGANHGREVDELELGALSWRRFAGIGPSELVELAATTSQGLRVAYAKGENEYVRLLREGERLPGVTGVYQVANQLTPRVRQLCRSGHWVVTNRRASDAWIAGRRVLPVDIDSVRASGQSATDSEKLFCYEAADRIEELLRQHVDRFALARGDSGNGLWLFIALQQVRCSEADDAQIAKLLKHLQRTFSTAHVKVDSTVANASRLVPAFGTLKKKGKATEERPHRRTTFTCAGAVRRVQLAELFG
jgi:hypothetical protein